MFRKDSSNLVKNPSTNEVNEEDSFNNNNGNGNGRDVLMMPQRNKNGGPNITTRQQVSAASSYSGIMSLLLQIGILSVVVGVLFYLLSYSKAECLRASG